MTRADRTMDETLLARMTGRLGDRKSLDAVMSAMGAGIVEALERDFHKATQVRIEAAFDRTEAGRGNDMLVPLQFDMAVSMATIGGWCDAIRLAADAGFVIALTERFLGGAGARPDAPRPLSDIEIDVATVLFEQTARALAATVTPADAPEVVCRTPVNAPFDIGDEDGACPDFAGVLTLRLSLPEASGELHVVVPQSVLLKTEIAGPAVKAAEAAASRPEWVEQLTQQVHTSSVDLQADIRLAPISIDTASRLAPGDVIPFADEEDVRVLLKANGKDLYWCAFGKSGNRYMLRLQERHGSEEDFMKQLTA